MHKPRSSKQMATLARKKENAQGRIEQHPKARFVPQTEMGRRLWQIRQRILASGQPLLRWEEIEKELFDRRGEVGAEG